MRSLEDPIARKQAHDIVSEEEAIAIENTAICEGVHDLMQFLDANQIPKALVTRNAQRAVDVFIEMTGIKFDIALTRDFEKGFKPSPAPLLHIADSWEIDAKHLLMVGDAKDDIISGSLAGFWTCLVHFKVPEQSTELTQFIDKDGNKHVPHLVLDEISNLQQTLEENLKLS
eukprot:TRINITY_DN1053_c0_g1_i1.p1 TRINITY_DN1053_c0_g1~~TRINITY_DN1053_c0_g1_i1.p1  ORF type:complete len:192 (-),score=47.06 TRINITY_DN1053_c0_g1_i1:2-517(-)